MINIKKLTLAAILAGLTLSAGSMFAAAEPSSPFGGFDAGLDAVRFVLNFRLRPTLHELNDQADADGTAQENGLGWQRDADGNILKSDVRLANAIEMHLSTKGLTVNGYGPHSLVPFDAKGAPSKLPFACGIPKNVKGYLKQAVVPRAAKKLATVVTGEENPNENYIVINKALLGASLDALSVPRDRMGSTFWRSAVKSVIKAKCYTEPLKALDLYQPSWLEANEDDYLVIRVGKGVTRELWPIGRNMAFNSIYAYASGKGEELRIQFVVEFYR